MAQPGKNKVYLDMDPPIRGQRYACVSFLSPEDVVLSRELFNCRQFLSVIGGDLTNMFAELKQHLNDDRATTIIDNLKERYSYLNDDLELSAFYNTFKSENAVRLENEFIDNNGGLTSVRALKIRGVYDSIDEARDRCNDLRTHDKGLFNIYVAQVGCWLPWSPNPEEIADSVFSDNQLNLLMNKYRENSKMRDKLYKDRVQELQPTPSEADDSVAVSEVLDNAPIVSDSGKVFY